MPGGPELLIILIVIAVPVVIVVVVLRFGGTASTAIVGDPSTIRLASDGRSWLVAVSGDRNRTVPDRAARLAVHDEHLRHDRDRRQRRASTVRLGGEFSNAAVDAINALVPD